jgi:enoyl-CoA hydratase/carnithine racemase
MSLVEVTREGDHVALVRLNRPDAQNALSPELMEELAAAVEAADADAGVTCIVINGGDEVFAAGADLGVLATEAPDLEPSRRFWERMSGCETPTIAAVAGFALGGGCELALLCDIIVCADSAEFGQPEITLGIIPGGGATQRLVRAVGRQHAMEIILTGRRVKAEEARKMGFVNAVHGRADYLEKAMEMAQVISRRPPLAARLAKQAAKAAEETGLSEGLAVERRLYERSVATEDRIEGVRAFREKRRPEFTGR